MTSHIEAEEFIATLNARAAELALAVHATLISQGCNSYVKTIYLGYDVDGEMVAAAYPHAASVEVALALDERRTGRLLIDASHLTWRTLPVAADVKASTDLPEFKALAAEACERVRSAEHKVMRDNEFFARRGNRAARR